MMWSEGRKLGQFWKNFINRLTPESIRKVNLHLPDTSEEVYHKGLGDQETSWDS